MQILTLLEEKREILIKEWAKLVFATYPAETQKIWKTQKDQFQNPVGVTIMEHIETLYDLILVWDDATLVAKSLESIIRIRSVQNFSASDSISFVYLYKKMLRDAFFQDFQKENRLNELLLFETRIDNLALIAFDVYSKTREEIYQLRVEEIKRAQHNLLLRANMIVDCSTP